jgi:serine/threonine protein kinase
MQDVYLAHDHLTDSTVALKTPQPGQATARFRQSAQMSARINHYSVAKTYDYFGVGGSCYLIEELVNGTTLEDATLAKISQVDPASLRIVRATRRPLLVVVGNQTRSRSATVLAERNAGADANKRRLPGYL